MLIQVTQEDIDKGCRAKSQLCPVHRAIERSGIMGDQVFGVFMTVFVPAMFTEQIQEKFLAPLPRQAQIWIREYDAGLKMRPFEFNLDLPAA